jgi:Gas vesicle protein
MAEQVTSLQATNLAELLERILDKGVVIVGDIKINLVDVELLTIKIRLLVASVDKAKALGINWWEDDPFVSSHRANGHDQSARVAGGDDLVSRE